MSIGAESAQIINASTPDRVLAQAGEQFALASKIKRGSLVHEAVRIAPGQVVSRANAEAVALERLVFAAILEEAYRSARTWTAVDVENAYVRLRDQAQQDPADFAVMLNRRLARGRGIEAQKRRHAA